MRENPWNDLKTNRPPQGINVNIKQKSGLAEKARLVYNIPENKLFWKTESGMLKFDLVISWQQISPSFMLRDAVYE